MPPNGRVGGLAVTVVAAMATLAADGGPAPPAPPGWAVAWQDDFDGPAGFPPSRDRWTVADNMTHGPVEQQLYVASAVSLDGAGHLVLTTARADPPVRGPGRAYNFTSGWVDTQGVASATFGRWEVRARLPDPTATGIWPAHWLMPEPSPWNCWPVGGEIDIMEMNGGVFNNTVLGTYHWGANCTGPPPPPCPSGAPCEKNCTCGCGCDLHHLDGSQNGQFQCTHPGKDPWRCAKAHDFSKAFHVFAVEWTPTSLVWFVDGEEYWRRTLGAGNVTYIPDEPFYLILNTAIQPAAWNRGAGAHGPYPVHHTVDYVRVLRRQSVKR